MPVVCLLLPRFQLGVAAGSRRQLLQEPAALAPAPGQPQLVGEASLPAEAFGVHPGLPVGEALARCPRLTLLPPDPGGVAEAWERVLVRLESVGAEVEPERPGLACFDAQGLIRLHGGLEGVVGAARRALAAWPARYGVAPSRFAAVAAATRASVRRPVIVHGGQREARSFLAPMPVALLRARPALLQLPDALERLGIKTLGELAALAPAALADRFGPAGIQAYQLASGGDGSLRPRRPSELVSESLDLPEAVCGVQLESALGLLIDRLLARPERRGRTVLAVVLGAALVERGGTWRERVVFREALADPVRIRLATVPRLGGIPAPAEQLRLSIERFGPPTADQRGLLDDAAAARAARLRQAIHQVRTVAGADGALRVVSVDPRSRLPERRMVLTPFEG